MIGSDIEFKFLYEALKDPQLFAIGYSPVDPLAVWSMKCIKEYSAKYKKYPTIDTFFSFVKDKCKEQQFKLLQDRFYSGLDTEYALDKIITLLSKQNLINGIRKAEELIAQDKIDEAKVALLKGSELVFSKTLNYFKDKRPVKKFETVTTGFKGLDAVMKGGLHKENLGLIIGPKGSGKSATMINLGANAIESGHNVLHISFEDSESQIAGRYDSRFKNTDRSKCGELNVHIYPAGQNTTADCETLVNAYRPELVLVDYLNEMGSENKHSSRSEDLGNRARGLKAISVRHNCGIWTAQQAGKQKKFSDVDVSAEDGFWSYEPSQVADLVMTINQTQEEKDNGIIRYNIDRHRNGADGLKFKFNIDYTKMLVSEIQSFL